VQGEIKLEGTTFHRVETTLNCCEFTRAFRNKLWFKLMTFCLVVLFDIADVFSVWSLFSDVVHVKRGLVFGPPEMGIIYALLFFSMLGTGTFSIEIINVWLEIFRNNPLIDPELLSVLTIWIEDVPQITINIFIALCREDAISYYQIIKAGVIIFGGFIRVLMGFLRFGDRQGQSDAVKATEKTGLLHSIYRFLIILGLFNLFFSSLIVCFLTLFQRTADGNLQFGTPKELFHGNYDRAKFFNNVSIYLNLPILGYDNTTDNTTLNWVRLTSIHDIKEKNGDTFKLTYDNMTNTKFTLWQSTLDKSTMKTKECFFIDREDKTLLKGPDDCVSFLEDEMTDSWIIHFKLIPEKIPELIFGDIHYNTLFMDENECRNITLQPVNDINDITDKQNRRHPVIHYFRTKQNVSETNHLVWESPTTPRFFNQETDLINITSIWKTGFGFCESTGSLAPHRNSSMHVDCQ
jgi:hypothetical protein